MLNLEISEIRIIPVKPQNGLVAFCSFLVNKALFVGDIAIYVCQSRPEGYRLVYPDKVLFNGKKVNVVHPISREADAIITGAVAKEFERVIDKLKRSESRKREGGLSDEQFRK